MNRIGLIVAALGAGTFASGINLWTASQGALPTDSSWGWTYSNLGTTSTVSGFQNGGVVFNSETSLANYGVEGKTSPVSLNRTTGYTVSWELQIGQEEHATDNLRAGFSVGVIGSDLKGVEIGYWNNHMFVYESDVSTFTPADGVTLNLDTTAKMRKYDLVVSGSTYTMKVDGSTFFTGNLRDYSARGLVYAVPNQIFIGDDTTRGASVAYWKSMDVVPEPASIAVLGLGLLFIRRRK